MSKKRSASTQQAEIAFTQPQHAAKRDSKHDEAVDADAKRPQPKTRSWLKRLFVSLLFFALVAGMGAALAYFYIDKALHQPRDFAGHTFRINKGDTLKQFIAQLEVENVLDEPYSLAYYARYKKLAGKLHTGQYRFNDGQNLIEVLDSITQGKQRLSHRLTFVQGSTFKQLRARLKESPKIIQTLGKQSDAEVLAMFDQAKQYTHPEGLFFPETYAFDAGTTDVEILRRAFNSTQNQLTELWVTRADDLQIKSPYEALILASIIEKETAQASERPKISGVFMNRLKKGMRLQTDPTVIYGIGDAYKGNITRKHLKTDTPYNTYTRYGLPPTPICLPGRAAIEAALHPEKTDAIYFVAKGDGSRGHQFSKTLKEHNRAVQAYLKRLRKARKAG